MKVVCQIDDGVYEVVEESYSHWGVLTKTGEVVWVHKDVCVELEEEESKVVEQLPHKEIKFREFCYIGDDPFQVLKSDCTRPDYYFTGEKVKLDNSVVSDGGSSSYYKLELPEWLIEKIVKDGAVETEDLIEVVFDSNFDYGNIFKSLVRAMKTEQGEGKAGNTTEYEMNKIKYSADKIKEKSSR